MIKVTFGISLLLLILYSCNKNDSTEEYNCNQVKDFSSENMMQELVKGNIEYAFCLIESLSDSTISDCEFADRVFAISDHLNFLFCGIDCQDSEWLSLPKSRRDTVRQVITYAYLEYRSSPLFMSKVDNVNCDKGDVYKFCRTEILFDEKLQEAFRSELTEIYNACKYLVR